MSLLITPKTFGAANDIFFFVFEGQKLYVVCMYDGEIKFFIINLLWIFFFSTAALIEILRH